MTKGKTTVNSSLPVTNLPLRETVLSSLVSSRTREFQGRTRKSREVSDRRKGYFRTYKED